MVREMEERQGLCDPTQTQWILEAINKIKHQKQRPSVERICSAVRQIHKISSEAVTQQLELAVKDGAILKVLNKGLWTYKDPAMWTKNKGRTLKLNRNTELIKVLVRSVKELGEANGSSLKSIEKYIQRSYSMEGDETNLTLGLKTAAKRALAQGLLTQEGRYYRAVLARSSTCHSDSDNMNNTSYMNGLNITIPDGLDFPVVIAQEEKVSWSKLIWKPSELLTISFYFNKI